MEAKACVKPGFVLEYVNEDGERCLVPGLSLEDLNSRRSSDSATGKAIDEAVRAATVSLAFDMAGFGVTPDSVQLLDDGWMVKFDSGRLVMLRGNKITVRTDQTYLVSGDVNEVGNLMNIIGSIGACSELLRERNDVEARHEDRLRRTSSWLVR